MSKKKNRTLIISSTNLAQKIFIITNSLQTSHKVTDSCVIVIENSGLYTFNFHKSLDLLHIYIDVSVTNAVFFCSRSCKKRCPSSCFCFKWKTRMKKRNRCNDENNSTPYLNTKRCLWSISLVFLYNTASGSESYIVHYAHKR